MKLLDKAIPTAVIVFPLVIFPGIDRPFSTPKLFVLAGLVITGGIIAACVGRHLLRPEVPPGTFFCLAAWSCVLIASAVGGQFMSERALWLPLLSAGWFLLLTVLRPPVAQIARAVALSCTFVAAVAFLQYVGLDLFKAFGLAASSHGSPRMRIFSTLGNPDFVAAFLVAGIPLTLTLGTISRRRVFFSFAAVLQGLAVFATGSRAAVLGIAAILLWFVISGRFPNRAWIVCGTLLTAGLLVFATARPLAATLGGRFYIWRVSASHLLERPFFGYGPGAFEPKYIQWETEYWRLGKGSIDDQRFAQLQEHAHNEYIETLVDNGIVGLACLISLLTAFFVSAFQRIRRTHDELLAAASAGLAALAAIAMVDFPFHRPAEMFLLWTLAAIAFMAHRPSTDTCRGRAAG
jgi:O-antigen ligase